MMAFFCATYYLVLSSLFIADLDLHLSFSFSFFFYKGALLGEDEAVVYG